MGRAPCCDKANVKKGPWSPDEDTKLKAFIEQNGTGGNWITLPSKAGLKRCGKSCRLRWINYLRPDIKHGSFTEGEEEMIYKLHASIGSRWSLIAAQLPGRTDNDIKNYWNTRLKKKLSEKKLEAQARYSPSSSPQEPLSENLEDVLTLPSCKTMNGLPSAGDGGLLSHILKASPYDLHPSMECPTMIREALPGMPMQVGVGVGVVKAELPAAADEVTHDHSHGVEEHLMMIESSLRSCIPHHSPTSSCSGISTDRSTHAQAIQCAESSYNECLSYGDEQSCCIQESDDSGLLPVTNAPAASSSLLVHNGTGQTEVGRGVEGLERFRLVDDGVMEDVMHCVLPTVHEESNHSNRLLEGVKDGVTFWATFNSWTPSKQPIRTIKQQPQHHFMPLQRYGESMLPSHFSLDPTHCYPKVSSWSTPSGCCTGNTAIGGLISDYTQTRFGATQSWDNPPWQLSQSR